MATLIQLIQANQSDRFKELVARPDIDTNKENNIGDTPWRAPAIAIEFEEHLCPPGLVVVHL